MARIHHTQHKQAAKFGITLAVDPVDGFVVASKGDKQANADTAADALALLLKELGTTTAGAMKALRGKKAPTAKKTKKAAKGKPKFKCEEEGCRSRTRESDGEGGFVCASCGADASMEGDEDGASVVKQKYKNKYRPHKMTCGDALAQQIAKEFKTKKDPDTKKMKYDWVRFTVFAKKNDCWSEDYKKVNNGMKRMNIVNRLRAKVADGHEIIWAV